MKLNAAHCFIFAAIMLTACNLNAAAEKNTKKNLRPQVAVIQKDGKRFLRRCFRDADNNGFCDRGSEQKGKCRNNCRKADAKDKKSSTAPKTTPGTQTLNNENKSGTAHNSGCFACCPFAGNCTKGCLALLDQKK